MRLVGVLLSLTLFGSIASADDGKPSDSKPEPARPKVPLRVVRTLPDTQQALLFDHERGTHVLAEVGQQVEGYTVDEIDSDEVYLLGPNGGEVVLAAPDASWRRGRDRASDRPAGTHVASTDAPAGTSPDDSRTPIDPYAEPEVRVVEAPAAPAAGASPAPAATAPASPSAPSAPATSVPAPAVPAPGTTATTAPVLAPAALPAFVTAGPTPVAAPPAAPSAFPAPSATPAPGPATPSVPAPAVAAPAPSATPLPGPATPSLAAPAPAATPAPAPTTPSLAGSPGPAAPAGQIVLTRGEVDAALANFAALAASIRGSFTPSGARLDAVSPGSLFARLGLVRGDVVTAIDDQPLASLDDAASLYARASSTRTATVHVLRGGKSIALHVVIR